MDRKADSSVLPKVFVLQGYNDDQNKLHLLSIRASKSKSLNYSPNNKILDWS